MEKTKQPSNIHPNPFKKPEHLCSDNQIENLFKNGNLIFCYPIKMYYQAVQDSSFNKTVFSAPKKIFKSAVKRNLIKRRMREAYRLNKFDTQENYNLGFIYIEKKILDYDRIEASLKKLLKQLP